MSAPATRRRPGPRRALTEDEILDAALSLLDEGGPEAASVRGIAARVGVAPNAVYTYFPDKAAVIKALVERLLGEVDHDVFADRGRPWRERVEALALDLRALLSAHPGAVSLMVGGPMNGAHALALNERLLELLGDAGLDRTEAARAAYLLIVYVFGSMALEVADVHQAGRLPSEPDRTLPAQLSRGADHGRLHLHRPVPLGLAPGSRWHHRAGGRRSGDRNRQRPGRRLTAAGLLRRSGTPSRPRAACRPRPRSTDSSPSP
jgi:TetR/AcrR family tetracycline transcriptional repressor